MNIELWKDFFVATAGASAALAGLVIVAMSVNVEQIIKYRNLPARAASTIGSLILILVVSCLGLMPESNVVAVGTAVLGFTFLFWILLVRAAYQSVQVGRQGKRRMSDTYTEIFLGQVQVIPFVVGGINLLYGSIAGLYWVAAGFIGLFVLSMLNAWVLLIEIRR